jgi:hypothetical protein
MVDIKTIQRLAPQLGITSAAEAHAIMRKINDARERPELRIQTILTVLRVLNPATDNDGIIWLCEKGLGQSGFRGAADVMAHLRITRANSLLIDVGFRLYEKRNITLAPRWKDFSLEKDKKEYDEVTKKINREESEAQGSYKQIEEYRSKETRAELSLALLRTEYWMQSYLNHKMAGLKPTRFRRFLRDLTRRDAFLYRRAERKLLTSSFAMCKKYIQEAFRICNDMGDELAKAEVYITYGRHLASALRYRSANRYAAKALSIARAYTNAEIEARAKALKGSIDRQHRQGR